MEIKVIRNERREAEWDLLNRRCLMEIRCPREISEGTRKKKVRERRSERQGRFRHCANFLTRDFRKWGSRERSLPSRPRSLCTLVSS